MVPGEEMRRGSKSLMRMVMMLSTLTSEATLRTNISYGPAKSFVFECKQSVELGDRLTLAKPCFHSAFLFFCFIGLKYKFSRHTSTNVNSQRKIENIKEIP